MPTQQREYTSAWVDAVVAGGYGPGVYCSFMLAAQLQVLRPNARLWVFHVRTVTPHQVPGTVFPFPDPHTSGFGSAFIWQHDDEAIINCPPAVGGNLTVDLNSAVSEDPSDPIAPQ